MKPLEQCNFKSRIRIKALAMIVLMLWLGLNQVPLHADDCLLDTNNDGNADTNVDTDLGANSNGVNARVACGSNATATGAFGTAVGADSSATATDATALGNNADATGVGSAALGSDTIASGTRSIAIGDNARATATGAIALGANVTASKANTMTVGVPIEVVRNDGNTQILVNEKIAGNSVKTLFNVICDTCTPGFRFNQTLPSNQTWNFRMLQSGAFSVDDPASTVKEAEFRFGGDLKIGGSLIEGSSRHIKKNIIQANPAEVLEKLQSLPIHHWTYNHQPDRIRHLGPMAEDFHKVFALGDTDQGIAGVDTAGVALAAIKALKTENDQLRIELSELKARVTQLANKEAEAQIARVSY